MEIRPVKDIEIELSELVKKVHNPKLAEESGHVYQIWSDGELTLQKSGSILNQREMHTQTRSLKLEYIEWFTPPKELFPCDYAGNKFAYVTKEDGVLVGNLIKEYVIANIFYHHNY